MVKPQHLEPDWQAAQEPPLVRGWVCQIRLKSFAEPLAPLLVMAVEWKAMEEALLVLVLVQVPLKSLVEFLSPQLVMVEELKAMEEPLLVLVLILSKSKVAILYVEEL